MYMEGNPHTNLNKKHGNTNNSETKSASSFKFGTPRRMTEISTGINSNIFRAYDIRGVYPSAINKDSAYLIGRAFVEFLRKPKPNIVIGRDNRLSSSDLFKGLSKGITDQGASVIDIGLSTTPMLYWACGFYGYDGGINITASHNPKEQNGFKLVREKVVPISRKTGLKQIYNLTKSRFVKSKKGKISKNRVLKDYLNFNLKKFNFKNFRKLKIVIDTANAVPGIIIPGLKKKLPIEIYSLFEKLDGKFPNHPPDPLIKKNLRFLRKEVKNKKADFGVAFDGDGDRVIFITERGRVISGDLISAFLADLILEQNPGAGILYDVRSSRVIQEVVKRSGGRSVIGRIGHSFIKEEMRKKNILFAGEFSGHYYLRNYYFSEAPLFVILKIAEALSKTGKKLSELVKPFKKYFHSGEINFRIRDKKGILELLERRYKNGKLLKIDGLRIDFKDWWFLARLSGTEDLLRLVVEARTKKLMEKRKKELSSLIKRYANL